MAITEQDTWFDGALVVDLEALPGLRQLAEMRKQKIEDELRENGSCPDARVSLEDAAQAVIFDTFRNPPEQLS